MTTDGVSLVGSRLRGETLFELRVCDKKER